jgi:hypothetical protein
MTAAVILVVMNGACTAFRIRIVGASPDALTANVLNGARKKDTSAATHAVLKDWSAPSYGLYSLR